MEALTRPALALTAATAVAFSSAMTAAPSALVAAPAVVPTSSAVAAQNVMLAGFIADIYNDIESVVADVVYGISGAIGSVPLVGPPIADQIDILYFYGEQAIGDTVYWVDDLVTPLVNLDFWPISGAPGNYLSNAAFATPMTLYDGTVRTAPRYDSVISDGSRPFLSSGAAAFANATKL